MGQPTLHRRLAEAPLREALADYPAVLLHGPRQCGKTTLVRLVGESGGYEYVALDDDDVHGRAGSDPGGFVSGLGERTVIDEVQLAPQLFAHLKQAIEANPYPGRFLLTSSTNVQFLPAISDSLAGHVEMLRLHPLSHCEVTGAAPGFLRDLFRGEFEPYRAGRFGSALAGQIVNGGYPAALARSTFRRRASWYRSFIRTQLSGEIRGAASTAALQTLPRLLKAAASQTARPYSLSALAAPLGLGRSAAGNRIDLLERLFLIERLPPWHADGLSRTVRSPRLHIGDTGVGCAMMGVGPRTLAENPELLGQMLESFVLQELQRQAIGEEAPLAFFHYRGRAPSKVDIVIESGAGEVAGVQVRTSSAVTESDFRDLKRLKAAAGDRFVAGVVAYDGEVGESFGDGMFAVPLHRLLGGSRVHPPAGLDRPLAGSHAPAGGRELILLAAGYGELTGETAGEAETLAETDPPFDGLTELHDWVEPEASGGEPHSFFEGIFGEDLDYGEDGDLDGDGGEEGLESFLFI